ncbi:type II toxin-antitoxin system prevent-host-death family antitoxin [Devosia sp. Root635]|uniref:type II toxin-antitoxin system prevent-host-death family antitoxin n=1 Tax=Devosia sp. Root635 TaxID=1736575 RepID=UPI0006FCBD3E|nr:type II toxin-antitoxin system prevent-host-death family antitoxin [Devosia sp. Root635]KRA41707.1 hypothetical protein ASD80_11725 [Devosia sp. Root635]
MVSVKSTEIQKTFGKWLDKTHEGPVEVTKYDRPAAYLISALQYEELISNYRKVITAGQLTDREVSLLKSARVTTDRPFNLDDLPDEDVPSDERHQMRA